MAVTLSSSWTVLKGSLSLQPSPPDKCTIACEVELQSAAEPCLLRIGSLQEWGRLHLVCNARHCEVSLKEGTALSYMTTISGQACTPSTSRKVFTFELDSSYLGNQAATDVSLKLVSVVPKGNLHILGLTLTERLIGQAVATAAPEALPQLAADAVDSPAGRAEPPSGSSSQMDEIRGMLQSMMHQGAPGAASEGATSSDSHRTFLGAMAQAVLQRPPQSQQAPDDALARQPEPPALEAAPTLGLPLVGAQSKERSHQAEGPGEAPGNAGPDWQRWEGRLMRLEEAAARIEGKLDLLLDAVHRAAPFMTALAPKA